MINKKNRTIIAILLLLTKPVWARYTSYGPYIQYLNHGNNGEIWGNPNSDRVVKISIKRFNQALDEKFNAEFNKQLKAHEKLQDWATDQAFFDRVAFLKPSNFTRIIAMKRCCFEMDRLYPIKPDTKKLVRVFLGKSKCYPEIEALVNSYPRISQEKTNFELLCHDFGKLSAILHLDSQNDGFASEVFLTKKSKDSEEYKLVIVDFGSTNDIASLFKDNNKPKIVAALVRSILRHAQCPIKNSLGFNQFMDGYCEIAKALDEKSNSLFYTTLVTDLFTNYKNEAPEVLIEQLNP